MNGWQGVQLANGSFLGGAAYSEVAAQFDRSLVKDSAAEDRALTVVEEIDNRVRSVTARLAQLLDRMAKMSERAHGPTPTAPSGGEAKAPQPLGSLSALSSALSNLDAVSGSLHEVFASIERIA